MGKKVLLVDNDWQGSATVHSGIKEPDDETKTLAQVLRREITAVEAIRRVEAGYDLLPGNGELVNVDVRLMAAGEAGVYALRDALLPIADQYDVILIDCEPGMPIRSLGALAAADYLLAPVSADYLSLKPLKLFLKVLSVAQAQYQQMPRHRVGVIVTRFDGRQNQAIEVAETIKRMAPAAGLDCWGIVVPERSAHRKAAVAGDWVGDVAGDNRDLVELYNDLAERVLAW